jgi:hypothetical protein
MGLACLNVWLWVSKPRGLEFVTSLDGAVSPVALTSDDLRTPGLCLSILIVYSRRVDEMSMVII